MTKPANSRNYEIRVRGVLGETLLQAFPGLQARTLIELTFGVIAGKSGGSSAESSRSNTR
jgi:hypothetical protein